MAFNLCFLHPWVDFGPKILKIIINILPSYCRKCLFLSCQFKSTLLCWFQFPRVRGRGWNRGNYPGNNSNGNPANMNPAARPPDEEWDPEYTPKSRKYYLVRLIDLVAHRRSFWHVTVEKKQHNMNEGWILFSCFWFSVLVLFMLAHCCGLLGL